MNLRVMTACAVVVAGLAVLPAPAVADDGGTSDQLVTPIAEASGTFGADEVEDVMASAAEPATSQEADAVEAYLDEEGAETGLQAADLEVGTLADGSYDLTVVAPADGVEVETVSFSADATTDQLTVGAEATDVPGEVAAQSGPGMGSWPAWADSFHSTVRISVTYDGPRDDAGQTRAYLGDAQFQTYKRKFANDNDDSRDSWQVSRYAIGRPSSAHWTSAVHGSIPVTVQKLWASQQLTANSQDHAKEWLWANTKPQEGFSGCSSGSSFTAGPFTWSPSNCEDYDPWTGAIGHYRMDFDQGTVTGTGQRAFSYVAGFSVDNGHVPSFTWYEFITFDMFIEKKCTSEERGPENGTADVSCVGGPS